MPSRAFRFDFPDGGAVIFLCIRVLMDGKFAATAYRPAVVTLLSFASSICPYNGTSSRQLEATSLVTACLYVTMVCRAAAA